MMKKFILTISIFIVGLAILSLFGWMSIHVNRGDKSFGILDEPVILMSTFLDHFDKTIKEVENLSATFLPIWTEFLPINNLKSDFHVLYSFSQSNNFRSVAIKNLKSDSIVFQWDIPEKVGRWDRVVNPYVYPNKDLIYFFTSKTGLRRIDSTGQFIWKQDSILPHHALNVDSAGNVWVCSKNPPKGLAGGFYKINGREVYYDDDYISKVDANTGNVLFHQSISEILKTNKLTSYLLQAQTAIDPIHLNDIQPALKTTKYFKEGDLFLSLKQSSIILHYRPVNNTVLRAIEGPFSAQHDVDFFNDSTLSIFNNNSYPHWTTDSKLESQKGNRMIELGNFYSNIVFYYLETESFVPFGEEVFRNNDIFTSTEGLHEFINDSTYFVEEQNEGYYWLIENDKVIYKDLFVSHREGYCHLPNWARVVDMKMGS